MIVDPTPRTTVHAVFVLKTWLIPILLSISQALNSIVHLTPFSCFVLSLCSAINITFYSKTSTMPTTSIVLLRFKPEATPENIKEVCFRPPYQIEK